MTQKGRREIFPIKLVEASGTVDNAPSHFSRDGENYWVDLLATAAREQANRVF